MSANQLVYPLNDGYIHHWLVAGPQATPIPGPQRSQDNETAGNPLTPQFYREQATLPLLRQGKFEPPVDQGSSEIEGAKLTWNYTRCREDHFVDVSSFKPTPPSSGQDWQHLRTWVYCELRLKEISLPSPVPVTFVLTTCGPADIWLNGHHLHRQDHFYPKPFSTRIQASLEQENTLLVCFEQVAVRECENVMAFQIVDLPQDAEKGISICVPTNARYPLRQQALERIFEHAYLEEVVNHRGAHFNLRWAEDLKEVVTFAYKIMDPDNYVYVGGTAKTDPAKPVDVGHPGRLRERPYFVTLEAPLKELFEHNLRYRRKLPIHVLDRAYSSTPDKDLPQRRPEALEEAAKFETNLFAEIAKMELERWPDLNPDLILASVNQVNRRANNSDILLVGLLGILYRYRDHPSLSTSGKAILENLRGPIEACVMDFKYWPEEAEPRFPEQRASLRETDDLSSLGFAAESHAILLHTCEILAGQLYPDRIFSKSGKSGSWHCARGEQLALDWMRKRGSDGFIDWNSNSSYEQVILALSQLTSLAEEVTVHELAAVLLDKMLFTLAVNSFKGAFGSTHGRTHASMIKSAQLEATSGITRLLWGMGVFNHHILGTVGLVCSNYEYPAFFAEIAADSPEEMWSKERHVVQAGLTSLPAEVNTVTYKTPDYMLSSAQDYRPGEGGSHEHIWQATMGADAVVFTTHPACMSESEAHHPGFWLGNVILPRVAQWKGVLIAIYDFSEQDWMGFTHAYFPTYAFDEHAFSKGWAFARKGKGYLALTSAMGFELNKRGPDGYRELRSYGHKNVWVCQMGREAKDGAFKDFQDRVSKLPLNFQDLAVRMTSLRGEDLAFSWQGPLTINGIEQPITGFKHIENPYCVTELHAKQMDISYGEYVLRLNYE